MPGAKSICEIDPEQTRRLRLARRFPKDQEGF